MKCSRPLISAIILLAQLPMTGMSQAETRVVISDKDCRRLTLKNASISADYVPGVDVRGKKVKSADLPDPNKIVIPDELSFDISPKIYQMLGVTAPTGLEDTAVTVGTVTVKKSGGVYFNGKRLNTRTRKELIKWCKEKRRKASKK
jgi:hypothetical protein